MSKEATQFKPTGKAPLGDGLSLRLPKGQWEKLKAIAGWKDAVRSAIAEILGEVEEAAIEEVEEAAVEVVKTIEKIDRGSQDFLHSEWRANFFAFGDLEVPEEDWERFSDRAILELKGSQFDNWVEDWSYDQASIAEHEAAERVFAEKERKAEEQIQQDMQTREDYKDWARRNPILTLDQTVGLMYKLTSRLGKRMSRSAIEHELRDCLRTMNGDRLWECFGVIVVDPNPKSPKFAVFMLVDQMREIAVLRTLDDLPAEESLSYFQKAIDAMDQVVEHCKKLKNTFANRGWLAFQESKLKLYKEQQLQLVVVLSGNSGFSLC